MTDQWFIVREGKRYGPYSSAQMKEFAGKGSLLPIDMVSQTGAEPWVPASQIEAIFPASVPSLPAPPPAARQPASVQGRSQAADKAGEVWRRVWGDKLLFVGICLGFSVLVCCPLLNAVSSLLPERLLHSVIPLFVLFNLALLITLIVLAVKRSEANRKRQKRQGHLHGLWEPVDREGQSFLFTKDGGMYRSDGFGAKYRWAADDKVELYEEGCEQTVQFTVLSLAELEMILKTGGQSCHFRRCQTITEAEMQRRHDEALRALANAGAVAGRVVAGVGKVALGTAAVLAAGGFAVLCGAGALAAAGSSEGGGGGGKMVNCPICDRTGVIKSLGSTSGSTCHRCGGKGWYLE